MRTNLSSIIWAHSVMRTNLDSLVCTCLNALIWVKYERINLSALMSVL